MGLQIPDIPVKKSDITNTAPSGADVNAIDLTAIFPGYNMRPDKWLVTVTVTIAPSDLTLWGLLATGSPDNATDDVWGLHNDKYLVIKDGKIGTGLSVGSHHFVVTDLGLYSMIYFQKSAGTVDVWLTPILKSERSS